MILPFSNKFPNGNPTYFIEKIWEGILQNELSTNVEWAKYRKAYLDKIGQAWDLTTEPVINPKLHTIRADEKNRWKVGNKIHPVVFNRSKNQFQLAPTLECKSIQQIEITNAAIKVDGRLIYYGEFKQLAINDGFENTMAFLDWFNGYFKGKIIHWTYLKY